MSEIKENTVYTPKETQQLLKISESTFKRLIKKGIIKATKIGNQHRIMGKHLLHLLNPDLEQKVAKVYGKENKRVAKKNENMDLMNLQNKSEFIQEIIMSEKEDVWND
jgi:excisionase family DNA binding protein